MTTQVTNEKFLKETLKPLCEKHGLPEEWATKRQASKFRNGKGRVRKNVGTIKS